MGGMYSSFMSVMLLALLIWGEARGEPPEGKWAVGWVVRNRVYAERSYGKGWQGVMLKKKQFSAFNEGDVNREKMEEVVFMPGRWGELKECFVVAFNVFFGMGSDYSNGATHYFRKELSPSWARKMEKTAEVGDHVFYKYKDE
tara:strand:- start:13530 stop:13958 length:429 start_codon:yes stop_codon:yes gene_type:complete